ncbi:MAG: glycoside hydrolase family 2 protein [Desulfitobacteriaceae bacterium]
MFNRRVVILFILFSLCLGGLYWTWQFPTGPALQAGQELVSAERWQMDLSGHWDGFSSLRKAWTAETEKSAGETARFSFLNRERRVTLPSETEFTVAARKFRIPAEWSSRTMQLVLNGVNGYAQIYLNGADSGHKLGEFEGIGGTLRLAIPAAAFRYGADNVILIQLSANYRQRSTLFGSSWPSLGKIEGKVGLEAVMETSLSTPNLSVAWQGNTALLTVQTTLLHHNLMEQGPWTVNAVLSDGSAGIAQASTVVQPGETEAQGVSLKLAIENPQRWSVQNAILYQLHLSVINAAGDRDDLALPLGLRALSMAGGKFLFNGQALNIKGTALTVEQEAQIRENGQISEFLTAERQKGVDLIYFIGHFPDPFWLQAADRIGMGVWVEWPVDLLPVQHLPNPEIFQQLVVEGNNHPSLWGWTVGKGFDPKTSPNTYLSKAEKAVSPGLAFTLRLNPMTLAGFPVERSPIVQTDKIGGPWGQVSVYKDIPGKVKPRGLVPGETVWPDKKSALVWAVVIAFLTLMNLRTVNWRYKEIGEEKPKRRLRNAWFWQSWSVVGRAGTLAGVVTTAVFQTPGSLGFWFPSLWPGLDLIRLQNPWLIWATLGLGITLLRIVQTGLAAPHLADSPHPWGLTLWLEQRYRWLPVVAGLWVAVPWGISWLSSLLAYCGFSVLFLPWRIRDIHRIGGHYRHFLILLAIFSGLIVLWLGIHFADWVYLWHMSGSGIIMGILGFAKY